MAQYTVRVELHHADDNDYETLHMMMELEGFSREILSKEGKTYHLPPAEYDRNGNLTPAQVLASAKSAAAATGCEASVLVTRTDYRMWSNLEAA